MAVVDLHGRLGEAEIAGNLFAKAAPCDMDHNLAFPGAQRFEVLPQGTLSTFTRFGISPCAVMKIIGI